MISDMRENHGFMPTYRGDPNFWKAIDNSFSPENVNKV